jgi:hypothetical protein
MFADWPALQHELVLPAELPEHKYAVNTLTSATFPGKASAALPG